MLQDPIQNIICCQVPLECTSFSDFPCQLLNSSGHLKNVPQLGLVWWFPLDKSGLCVLGKKNRGAVRFSSHHIKGTYDQHNVTADLLVRIIFEKFHHYEVTPFVPFQFCTFWKKITMYIPHQEWGVMFYNLRFEYLHKFFQVLLYRHYLLSHLLIYINHLFMLYFGIKSNMFYFVAQLASTLVSRNHFFGLFVPLTLFGTAKV
jgi:hypothetical protein